VLPGPALRGWLRGRRLLQERAIRVQGL